MPKFAKISKKIENFSDELGPDESIEHVVTFSSSRTGSRNLIVDIDSNEQPDFQNSAVITNDEHIYEQKSSVS